MNSEKTNIDKAFDIDKIREAYEQPAIEVLTVDSEGILCGSGPGWEDGGGAWGSSPWLV